MNAPRTPVHRNGEGWAQAREVFLRGCGLLGPTSAWQGASHWTILETGFGLGLNALAAWHAWREDPQRPARLHLVGIEASPVAASDLVQSVAAWPELQPLAQALSRQWWGLTTGLHRLTLEDGRVSFTLLVGPVSDLATSNGFAGLMASADSVFLNGPGPEPKPSLWSTPTLQALSAHTQAHTRLATECDDGDLRQRLEALGWVAERLTPLAPGLQMRRAGQLNPLQPQRPTRPTSVWVVGAGLAGAAVARQWAERGVPVRVLDARAQPAQGASGLPVGLITPHGARQRPELAQLTLTGMRHMHHLGERWLQAGVDWSPCGVTEQRLPDRRGKLPPLPTEHDDSCTVVPGLCGQPQDAVHHRYGAWIRPQALVKALLHHPLIDLRMGQSLARVARSDSGAWQALDGEGQVLAQAPWACLAAGPGTAGLYPHDAESPLRLHAVRGQVSWVPMAALAQAGLPSACVNGQGSWIPNFPLGPQPEGVGVFGAGFDHHRLDESVRPEDHLENLQRLQTLFPEAFGDPDAPAPEQLPWQGWSGVRCTTPDRLPWCGPLPKQPGLHVLTALGARGLTLGALLAEALVAQSLGEPGPLPAPVWQALRPQR